MDQTAQSAQDVDLNSHRSSFLLHQTFCYFYHVHTSPVVSSSLAEDRQD